MVNPGFFAVTLLACAGTASAVSAIWMILIFIARAQGVHG